MESFLHHNAIQFEKAGIARTYLVFFENEQETYLAGYYSIANKALNIDKKNFERLSNSQKKILLGQGHRTDKNNYAASSILLGQLGKNDLAGNEILGVDILGVAYKVIKDIYNILGGKVLWLECEDNEKIKAFYERNGFSLLRGFQSKTGLLVYIKKLSQV